VKNEEAIPTRPQKKTKKSEDEKKFFPYPEYGSEQAQEVFQRPI
jgi:hypothetical protein